MRDDARACSADTGRPTGRLYPRLLGGAWTALHPAVQRVHTDAALTDAGGIFRVSRAPGWLIGRVLDLMRVPRASDTVQVCLTVEQRGPAERWCRVFEGRPLITLQTEAPGGLLAERIGSLEFRFRLAVKDGELLFRQESLAVCLGSWRLPMPHGLAPQIAAREGAASEPGWTRVEVRVTTPGGSLLFSYRGAVHWAS